MALTLPAHVFVANLLHATVPLFFAIVIAVVGGVVMTKGKTPMSEAMANFNKGLFYLISFYGFVTAFVGLLLVTNYDSMASIFGIGLEQLQDEFEAIHGAIDITTPTVVSGATIRDVQLAGSAVLTLVAGTVQSWYYVNGEYTYRFLTALLFMSQGIGLFLIGRAETVEQIVAWSITGGVMLIAYFTLSVTKKFLKIRWNTWGALLPVAFLAIFYLGLWATTILASPATGAPVTYEATAWIFPGFHSVYLLVMPALVYLTRKFREPLDGKSWGAIHHTSEDIARGIARD